MPASPQLPRPPAVDPAVADWGQGPGLAQGAALNQPPTRSEMETAPRAQRLVERQAPPPQTLAEWQVRREGYR